MLMCKKSRKAGWKMAWLSEDLLLALRSKKTMHSQWNLWHVTWEVQGYGLRVCRGGIRKTKTHMKWDVARDVKSNEKGLHKYRVYQKRKDKEKEPPVNKKGELVTTNIEKAEVLTEFFALVFSGSQACHVLGFSWLKSWTWILSVGSQLRKPVASGTASQEMWPAGQGKRFSLPLLCPCETPSEVLSPALGFPA